ncbi:MAG: hypothetical protein D8M52_01010 [Chlorobi bacterium]|nr:MAG: hypothetical protein F9K28_00240 [Bacteroidota bacterium]KXK35784.1 MAG: hypothetical protein UZ06_CHB003000249 [Chlorobi bacterium OLB6]MBE2265253.1 hypothetical protein [Flavobacteriales bacterium]MBL1160284.1 hypothetical protein [Chlorobiota bacterium]MBW7853422.1 hypothetical protein [Candidatus Kapabacteria bacterium]MCC6330469.1 hypothetical protein [Ignavibacteria bacterium]
MAKVRYNSQLFFISAAFLLITGMPLPLLSQSPRSACILTDVETVNDTTVRISWMPPEKHTPAAVFVRRHQNADWTPLKTVDNAPFSAEIGDTTVTEVQIIQQWTVDSIPFVATGYVGLNRRSLTGNPIPSQRILILVEAALSDALANDITILTTDLLEEGWMVDVEFVPGNMQPAEIKKTYIVPTFFKRPEPLTHLYLIGHIPYATSGGFNTRGAVPNPDYHPEHGGAWASDLYYADVRTSAGVPADYQWTDSEVNIQADTVANRTENKNVPGDGKFDASLIPTDIELCVGRVDMWDLPAMGSIPGENRSAEIKLLKHYLNKVHNYRIQNSVPVRMGVIDDNFGLFTRVQQGLRITEAFSASAWRSFSAIVGSHNVIEGDWIPDQRRPRPSLDTLSVLLAYGCGGGGYEHCDGVGNTAEIASAAINATFTLLFGSYFGDVNSTDNIMRTVLATKGTALTCGWSGRPHWFMHGLASGETIGECMKTSACNTDSYIGATIMDEASGDFAPYYLGSRGIHIMLLGDPTLRLQGPALTEPPSISTLGNTMISLHIPRVSAAPGEMAGNTLCLIESAPTRNDQFVPITWVTILSESDTTVSIPIPTGHTVLRIRPVTTSENLPGPLWGKGALIPLIPSSVSELTANPAGLVRYFNLMGCELYPAGEQTGSGCRLDIVTPNGDSMQLVLH